MAPRQVITASQSPVQSHLAGSQPRAVVARLHRKKRLLTQFVTPFWFLPLRAR